jgi:hypothetical protein
MLGEMSLIQAFFTGIDLLNDQPLVITDVFKNLLNIELV